MRSLTRRGFEILEQQGVQSKPRELSRCGLEGRFDAAHHLQEELGFSQAIVNLYLPMMWDLAAKALGARAQARPQKHFGMWRNNPR